MVGSRLGSLVCVLVSLAGVSTRGAAQVGAVLGQKRITTGEGGFTGRLHEEDYFGTALTGLGDVNGDGTPDLAVSAYGDDTAGPNDGAVWILFLGRDGGVIGQNRITGTHQSYSHSLASLPDMDGDGISELVVGNYRFTTGSVDILFLAADGSVKRVQRIEPTDPVFFPPITGPAFDNFAVGLTSLPDVDGDGVGELAIGAPGDDDGPGNQNGAIWIVRLQNDGRPKSAHKISESWGGGAGRLDVAQLGERMSSLGDLDGDGNPDLVVRDAPLSIRSYTPSALLILFLDGNQELRDVKRIPQEEFGFVGDGDGHRLHCFFGASFANLGDLDRDGTLELAIGVPMWTPDAAPPPWRGAVVIASLRSNGSLARHVLLTQGHGGFQGVIPDVSLFGKSLANLGDVDGDGTPDLALGAPNDSSAGDDFGALWTVKLDGDAVRNGSGSNPLTLSQRSEPFLGLPWKVALDCSGQGPGLATVFGYGSPRAPLATPLGELLVDLTSPRLFRAVLPHSGGPAAFLIDLPNDPALFGLAVSVQGLCSGVPRSRLSDALDVVVAR